MLTQLLPSSCPYFITHQWTEPFWPGLMMAQDKHLSSHQHWLTHLCTTQAPEHGTAPQPGNDLPWFGLTSVLYWPDKGTPGSTPAQGTCPSALSTALLEVTLRLLPGKTLSGIRSAPVPTPAEWSDFFANFTGEHVKLLCPLAVSAAEPVLPTKNARLPGYSTDSQQLANNF